MLEWQKVSKKISNWGRWGAQDELGTLNLITPQRVASAATLVKTGKTFSLSVPLNADGPEGVQRVRRNPIHLMSLDGTDSDIERRLGSWGGAAQAEISAFWGMGPMRFNDDYIIMPSQASTQWDAVSHIYYDDQMYNGFPSSAVTSLGANAKRHRPGGGRRHGRREGRPS